MYRLWGVVILIIIGSGLMSHTSWAARAYVTDQFRISLRRGPSTENKILKFLPSGFPVDILETQEGWNLVQAMSDDQNSIKGWILSRYLITRLPWKDRVEPLLQENEILKEKLSALKRKWNSALKLETDKYSKLKALHNACLENIKRLTKENERLRSSQTDRLFMLGALVLLCGLIIGLVAGRQKKRRLIL